MNRRVLPNRRPSVTFSLRRANIDYLASVGFFEDGTPAEIFVTGTKAGSDVEAVSRDGAVLLSLALQHGVPLETLKHAITRAGDGSPASVVGELVDRLAKEAAGE